MQLSNISVVGYSLIGCSAVMIHESSADIRDSKFVGIQGLFGAALMISTSNVMITGNNYFVGNAANTGGSIYLFSSTLTLNGTNRFMNNTSYDQERSLDDMCYYYYNIMPLLAAMISMMVVVLSFVSNLLL